MKKIKVSFSKFLLALKFFELEVPVLLLFPLYLKELEFRYNKRSSDLYRELLKVLRGGLN
ncbi:hypothetical protein [Thermodesulfobacterium hydrogeniphilum]|uniref:hypothetical protein n=1 Tax=Thermodesulfobacterium hydrogeniphilum TaxID=161156 RepID=UPI00056F6366|nr:hypothetical protein [Thermodesulfobacterium hydrogeniphilum]